MGLTATARLPREYGSSHKEAGAAISSSGFVAASPNSCAPQLASRQDLTACELGNTH
jgi:hypothetical protein